MCQLKAKNQNFLTDTVCYSDLYSMIVKGVLWREKSLTVAMFLQAQIRVHAVSNWCM